MLTINECFINHTKVFSRQSAETKASNLAILNYIKHLGDTSSVNIAAWDIESLFSDKTNKKQSLELIKNRNEINKIFFTEVERTRSDNSSAISNIEKILTKNFDTILTKRKNDKKRRFENEIQSKQEDLNTYIQYTANKTAEIVRLRTEILSLDNINASDKIVSDLKEILSGNFYEFIEIANDCIVFKTKNDIVNTLIKPSAGLNIKVNLGKFKISINLMSLSIKIYGYENNVMARDTFVHPHVSRDGNVCWGNVSEQAANYLTSLDLKNTLLLLATLLVTYNENNPYAPLYEFEAKRKELDAAKKTEQTVNAPPTRIIGTVAYTNNDVPF